MLGRGAPELPTYLSAAARSGLTASTSGLTQPVRQQQVAQWRHGQARRIQYSAVGDVRAPRPSKQNAAPEISSKPSEKALGTQRPSLQRKKQSLPEGYRPKRQAHSTVDSSSRRNAYKLDSPANQQQVRHESAAQPKPSDGDASWREQDAEAVDRVIAQSSRRGAGDPKILLGKSLEEFQAVAALEGLPKHRGKQLYEGIIKGAATLHDIKNIPKAMREALVAKEYSIGRSFLQQSVNATDGTRKFLLKLHDGRVVEAVGIPNEKDSRLTACISSQVGCPMRCTFCATGKGGFARNLMPHEIIDQVLTVQEQFGLRVSNVVFMGMGEPMLNLRAVVNANRFIMADIGIGARHITISSVGVPNALMKLASYRLQNTLAISIHAPSQELRERIVPSARAYPLEALMLDCQKYFEVTGRRITFEYTLMAGVNDSPDQANQLVALLKRYDLRGHVNLIPWNPVDESDFQRPTKADVTAFASVLTEAGVPNSVRVTRGLEAAAACGQLRNQHQKAPARDAVLAA